MLLVIVGVLEVVGQLEISNKTGQLKTLLLFTFMHCRRDCVSIHVTVMFAESVCIYSIL